MTEIPKEFQSPSSYYDDSWKEHRLLILNELKRLEEAVATLTAKVEDLRVEVKELQLKAGLWGATAGLVTIAIFIAYELMKGKL